MHKVTHFCRRKILFLLTILFTSVLISYYSIVKNIVDGRWFSRDEFTPNKKVQYNNVWLIFTKIRDNLPLQYKFHNIIKNILERSTVPLQFHIIVDNSSNYVARQEISYIASRINKSINFKLYDMELCAKLLHDIVEVMTPHFSSKPGTYYSGALFYISLGLHRIAPKSQEQAVLLDCDIYFKKDIKLLFDEFEKFKPRELFGLAPELTPVYRHVLQGYTAKHNTTFGQYHHVKAISRGIHHERGFQGYNSGVVLLNLSAIRQSKEYFNVLQNETIQMLTSKYLFQGHLGDQDFYTLIGFEYPYLIYNLHCGFNRQLCTWWRDHGYKDMFDLYFKCKSPTIILHGNCNYE